MNSSSNISTSPPTTLPGHLGDLMSSRETTLVIPEGFLPMQRILLTANGNVQRLISSYYNSTVTVKILKNERQPSEKDKVTFDREVDIYVFGHVCCHAVSKVTISNPEYLKLVVEQQVGIGQLFRYLSILPEFQLVDIGRTETTFWRRYILSTNGIVCDIHEDFPLDVWELNQREPVAPMSPGKSVRRWSLGADGFVERDE